MRRLLLVGLMAGAIIVGCVRPTPPAPIEPVAITSTILTAALAPEPTTVAFAPDPTAVPPQTPTVEILSASPTASETVGPPEGMPEPAVTPTSEPPPTAAPAATGGPTPDGTVRSVRVPILMYHYISQPPPGADVYRRDLSVAPDRFETHLAYLRDAGYHVVTLDDLLYALAQGRALPEKPVILTFDDGYVDNYTNAFPLLKKYGVVGHFFLITDFIDEGRAAYMSWQQIKEMADAGQQFGSHSRNHPDLRGKPVDYLVWQALGGEEAIQAHLGYHPRWIAYPSGAYDSRTIAVYKSANYWGGLTTNQGGTQSSSRPFELSRVRVRGTYTDADLARLLELDW